MFLSNLFLIEINNSLACEIFISSFDNKLFNSVILLLYSILSNNSLAFTMSSFVNSVLDKIAFNSLELLSFPSNLELIFSNNSLAFDKFISLFELDNMFSNSLILLLSSTLSFIVDNFSLAFEISSLVDFGLDKTSISSFKALLYSSFSLSDKLEPWFSSISFLLSLISLSIVFPLSNKLFNSSEEVVFSIVSTNFSLTSLGKFVFFSISEIIASCFCLFSIPSKFSLTLFNSLAFSKAFSLFKVLSFNASSISLAFLLYSSFFSGVAFL